MKHTFVAAAAALFAFTAVPAFAGVTDGPVKAADDPVEAAVPTLPPCHAFCNAGQSLFGANMASDETIAAMCPADSIAAGGDVVYEISSE